MDDDVLGYVNKSTYRVRTLKAIGRNVRIPKEIARDSGILQNHVSNVLRQLKDKGLVECLKHFLRYVIPEHAVVVERKLCELTVASRLGE